MLRRREDKVGIRLLFHVTKPHDWLGRRSRSMKKGNRTDIELRYIILSSAQMTCPTLCRSSGLNPQVGKNYMLPLPPELETDKSRVGLPFN
jgi:hypothetical protein